MAWRRALVSILFTFAVFGLRVGTSSAQATGTASGPSGTGTSLLVPVSGVAGDGAVFAGTLLVQRFAAQATGVAASGTVGGVLTATDGSARNLVFQTALPLDISSSLARLNSDPVLAGNACGVLHVALAATLVTVPGSTIDLNPVGFDIAAAGQPGMSTSGTPATSTGSLATPLSASATQVSPTPQCTTTVPTPGPTPIVPAASTAAPAPASLGSLLCAVNGFRNTSNLTQLVQQLNGIVTALAASGS